MKKMIYGMMLVAALGVVGNAMAIAIAKSAVQPIDQQYDRGLKAIETQNCQELLNALHASRDATQQQMDAMSSDRGAQYAIAKYGLGKLKDLVNRAETDPRVDWSRSGDSCSCELLMEMYRIKRARG